MKQKLISQGAEAKIYLIEKLKKLPAHKSSQINNKVINNKTSKLASDGKLTNKFEMNVKENKIIIKDRISKSYRIKELDDRIRRLRTRSEEKILKKLASIIKVPAVIDNNSKQAKRTNVKGNLTQIKMQFIDGKRLSEHLNNLPLNKQKQIIKEIGRIISKLHKENICHGDLTTSNMILIEDEINNNKNPNKGVPTLTKSQAGISRLINNTKNDEVISKKFHNDLKEDNLINYQNERSEPKSGREFTQDIISKRNLKNPSVGSSKAGTSISLPQIFLIDFGLSFQNARCEDKAVDIHLFKQALEAKHWQNWEILYKEFIKAYKFKNKTESEKVLNQLNKVEKRGRYKH